MSVSGQEASQSSSVFSYTGGLLKTASSVKSHHIVLIFVVLGALLVFHFRHRIAEAHDRFRTRRRMRYASVSSSFADDLEDGLSSANFDIEANIASGDLRLGLLEAATAEIKRSMASKGLLFDEARLQYLQGQLGLNNIGADGVPLDPRTVTFS